MSNLKQNLIEERKTKGYTQLDMAEKLSIPANTYGNWERGHSEPSTEMLIKLANIFEVSTDYLLGRATEVDTVNITTDLTAQQKELLNNFEKLNAEGKARLLGYLIALLGMPMYAHR